MIKNTHLNQRLTYSSSFKLSMSRFKYNFTLVDNFIKYEWVILLDDKKAEMTFRDFKKCISTYNIPAKLLANNW